MLQDGKDVREGSGVVAEICSPRGSAPLFQRLSFSAVVAAMTSFKTAASDNTTTTQQGRKDKQRRGQQGKEGADLCQCL
jgi:hypothetical protein